MRQKMSLFEAVKFDSTEAIEELKPTVWQVNDVDEQWRTPLHHAAMLDRRRITRLLLEIGANPNPTDRDGCTPLDYAKASCCSAIMDMLREKGGKHSHELSART